MVKYLAVLGLLCFPAIAFADGPSEKIHWAIEPEYQLTVIEEGTMPELWERMGITREVLLQRIFNGYRIPATDPAPIPLPWPGLLLTTTLVILRRMRK